MKFLTLRTKKTIGIVLSAALLPGIAMAKLTAEEEAKLGINDTELTPMGAVRAGNAEGTIPAWNSEPMPIPAGGTADSLADPFADEKPLFTITAQNYTEHMDKLTAGQIGLFKQYPDSYKMHVYPSHRTGAYDKWVYDATMAQAKNVEMCDEYATESKVCLKNDIAGGGIPFPIPKSGAEAAYNHFFTFKGVANDRMINGALIDSNGNRTDVIIRQRMITPYWFPADSEIRKVKWYNRDGIAMLCDSWQVEKPPRSSGLVFGGCNYVNDFDFQTYLYVPGQRRVRKAPEIGFHDSPSFASDGQRTVASRWMHYFGGKNTRFDFAKPVKKEMYVAYNNYKLGNQDLPFDEIFGEEHINPEVIRYELHRVWVIDTTLKEGQRHLYKRHTAYFDEDTWLGLAFEAYDAKDRLWRVGEQYNVMVPGPNVGSTLGDMQVDLINGRYTTFPYWQYQAGKEMGFGGPKVVSKEEDIGFNIDIFTPQGLRRFGRR